MTAQELLDRVAEMLGFRITERENDAVLVRERLSGSSVSSVRPASREEMVMFLRIIGLVARLDALTIGLDSADSRIKELMIANRALTEERDLMTERLKISDRQSDDRETNFQQRMSAALEEIGRLNGQIVTLQESKSKSKGKNNG